MCLECSSSTLYADFIIIQRSVKLFMWGIRYWMPGRTVYRRHLCYGGQRAAYSAWRPLNDIFFVGFLFTRRKLFEWYRIYATEISIVQFINFSSSSCSSSTLFRPVFRSWPSRCQRFEAVVFSRDSDASSTSNPPNLVGQVISLCLAPHSQPAGHVWS